MSSLVRRSSLRSTALAALSAVASFGAVTAPAHAEFKKQLNFACTYPILKGAQPLSLAITAQIPDTYPINTFTPAFAIHADATASGKTNQAIDLIGASSISGESVATSHLTAPGTDLDLDVPISIAKQAVDSSQTNILLAADGSTPPIKFKQTGTLLITVQGITLQLTGYDDQGNILTGIPNAPGSEDDGIANTFGVACVLSPADQDTLLATTTLTGPGTTPYIIETRPVTTPVITTPRGTSPTCTSPSPPATTRATGFQAVATTNSATISWNGPVGDPTAVSTGCFPAFSGYSVVENGVTLATTNSSPVTLTGLAPNSSHTVRVVERYQNQFSVSSGPITFFVGDKPIITTPIITTPTTPTTPNCTDAPPPPTTAVGFTTAAPTVTAVSSTGATVTWTTATVGPSFPCLKLRIDGYDVLVNGNVVGSFGAGIRTDDLTGLTPSTAYSVTIRPRGNYVGVASPATKFTTPAGATTPGAGCTAANPDDCIDYGYSLKGAATLKNLVKGALPLSGTIAAHLNINDGSFNAELGLNQTTGNLTALGFLPVTATVQLVPTAPVTGSLVSKVLTANAKVRIKLPSIKSFGIQLAGGANCQATQISTIPLKSTADFFPTQGGTIAGTFSISNLSGCGVLNGIVSPLTSGSGNAISLALTPSN